jgi:hypothetical protein
MSNLQQETVNLILDALHSTNLTIESFVISAISAENPLSRSFLNGGIKTLLERLLENDLINVTVSNWVTFQAMKIYQKEMSNLTSKDNGFHFLTAKMTQKQLQTFDVDDLMKRMMVIAPDLWRLMETLHAANSRINLQRAWTQKRSKKVRDGKSIIRAHDIVCLVWSEVENLCDVEKNHWRQSSRWYVERDMLWNKIPQGP